MLILTATTDALQVVLAGAITTNQLQCVSSWRDVTTTTFTPGRTVTNTNSTSDVSVVPAPAASTQRVIDLVNVYNADTVPATVTVKYDANGTEYILWKDVLPVGETLSYQEGRGWAVTTDATLVLAGTWTPTLTNTTNLDASTPFLSQYLRVGNVVNFSGRVDLDPTAAASVVLGMSLPIASNFANNFEAGGTFANPAVASEVGAILADATNNRLTFQGVAISITNQSFFFSGSYLIV